MRQIDPYKRICFMCEQADLVPKDVCQMAKCKRQVFFHNGLWKIVYHLQLSGISWKALFEYNKKWIKKGKCELEDNMALLDKAMAILMTKNDDDLYEEISKLTDKQKDIVIASLVKVIRENNTFSGEV